MPRLFAAALISMIGLIYWQLPREQQLSARFAAAEKSAMTGEFDLVDERPSPHVLPPRAATTMETIEHLAVRENVEHLEKMFSDAEKLDAAERAALIDAAFVLDDPQLISRAEQLALRMVSDGSEADVLMVLPKIAMFPENSPLKALPQESLCRFHGLGLEIVKLKYDRVFPGGRPWPSVCSAG